jgi:hypothetical protein
MEQDMGHIIMTIKGTFQTTLTAHLRGEINNTDQIALEVRIRSQIELD